VIESQGTMPCFENSAKYLIEMEDKIPEHNARRRKIRQRMCSRRSHFIKKQIASNHA